MKNFKNKAGLIIAIVITLVGLNFSSEIIYLSELASTVYKIQRTKADITDYKYFENIEISKSNSPQPWPIHKNYNHCARNSKFKKNSY